MRQAFKFVYMRLLLKFFTVSLIPPTSTMATPKSTTSTTAAATDKTMTHAHGHPNNQSLSHTLKHTNIDIMTKYLTYFSVGMVTQLLLPLVYCWSGHCVIQLLPIHHHQSILARDVIVT